LKRELCLYISTAVDVVVADSWCSLLVYYYYYYYYYYHHYCYYYYYYYSTVYD